MADIVLEDRGKIRPKDLCSALLVRIVSVSIFWFEPLTVVNMSQLSIWALDWSDFYGFLQIWLY